MPICTVSTPDGLYKLAILLADGKAVFKPNISVSAPLPVNSNLAIFICLENDLPRLIISASPLFQYLEIPEKILIPFAPKTNKELIATAAALTVVGRAFMVSNTIFKAFKPTLNEGNTIFPNPILSSETAALVC